MILTCPECATSYFVDDARIPPGGRSVKCSNCDARWTAMPAEPAEEPSAAARTPAQPFEPGDDVSDLEVIGPAKADPPRSLPPVGKPYRARGRGDAGGKVTVWIVAALVVALAVTAALVFRGAVVRAFPGTQAAYAGVGLPVNPPGLTIEGVKAQPTFEGGRPVLAVIGAIRNERDTAAVAPSLRVNLLDRSGKTVASKIAKPTDPRIPPRATRHFAVILVDPPVSGHDLEVKFEPAAPGDAAATPTVPVPGPGPQDAKPAPSAVPAPSPAPSPGRA